MQRNLKEVVIPDSVNNIGEAAFMDCISLKNVTIPDSVNNIGEVAFMGCESLKTVTIPESVKVIGREALGYLSSSRRIGYCGSRAADRSETRYRDGE